MTTNILFVPWPPMWPRTTYLSPDLLYDHKLPICPPDHLYGHEQTICPHWPPIWQQKAYSPTGNLWTMTTNSLFVPLTSYVTMNCLFVPLTTYMTMNGLFLHWQSKDNNHKLLFVPLPWVKPRADRISCSPYSWRVVTWVLKWGMGWGD